MQPIEEAYFYQEVVLFTILLSMHVKAHTYTFNQRRLYLLHFKSSGRNDGLKLFHTAWFTRNFVRLLQSQRDDIFSSFFFHFRMVIHPPLMR